jgi:transcriptional regulator with XRE-family HTH domain
MAVTPAEIIQRRRAELGLSQEQLAERLGRTTSTVRRWEKGEVTPPGGVIPTLARALQVAPRDLAVAFGAIDPDEPEVSQGAAARPAPRPNGASDADTGAPVDPATPSKPTRTAPAGKTAAAAEGTAEGAAGAAGAAAAGGAGTAATTRGTAAPTRPQLPIDEQATVAAATAVAPAKGAATAPVAAPPQQPKRRSPLRRAAALDLSEGLSYLEDSRQRLRYWLRAALTIVAIIILLMILVWAFGEFWDALGKVWDLFGDEAPPVTAPGAEF